MRTIFGSSLLICTFLAVTLYGAENGNGHSGWGWFEPIGRWINLAFIAGLIYFAVREPAGQFFRGRREGIQKDLAEAKAIREEAAEKLAQIEKRTQALDSELKKVRDEARENAEKERARLLEEAEKDAEKIVQAALREVEGLTRAAHREVREYAAELALKHAEERLKAELAEPKREALLFNRFFEKLAAQARSKD